MVKVNGRIDPVLADFLERALERAARDRSTAVVIQLDSPGALLSGPRLDRLVSRIAVSPVPVAVWVGPSGAVAFGDATRLVEAADVAAMATRTRIGRSPSVPETLSAQEARQRGLVELASPTLRDLVVDLDGRQVDRGVLRTVRPGPPGTEAGPVPAGDVRFARLGFLREVLHGAASPQVAYLLLALGLALLVLEFFSAGIGIAGTVGAMILTLAAWGLGVLPTAPAGLALVLFGVVAMTVDVQAGSSRTWTAIGLIAFTLGSFRLFGEGLAPSWITVVLVVAGLAAFMVSGMPSMLRARFSTPTVGRYSMIGQMGAAQTRIDPDGTVALAGGLWRARTNRATPIDSGDAVRVVAIDGLVLEVEPEEGGARSAGH
jgi:membrane-bound serine protease (ClpP class)